MYYEYSWAAVYIFIVIKVKGVTVLLPLYDFHWLNQIYGNNQTNFLLGHWHCAPKDVNWVQLIVVGTFCKWQIISLISVESFFWWMFLMWVSLWLCAWPQSTRLEVPTLPISSYRKAGIAWQLFPGKLPLATSWSLPLCK